MDFLEIFTSGRYQRYENSENISLKLQAVYGIFKKWQIDDDKVGPPNTTIS